MTAGLRVFRSLKEALAEGFQVYDRTPTGYLVRAMIGGRWQLAIVDLRAAV
jgi:hypothetical protein